MIDKRRERLANENRAAGGRKVAEIDTALAQCEAALTAVQKRLLTEKSPELLDIADGFAQLKELPTIEE